LTVKPTLLSLDASIADVPIKQHRSAVWFDRTVSNILMPLAKMNPSQALRFRLYDLDLRSCACHSVDTCSMTFKRFFRIFRINVAQYSDDCKLEIDINSVSLETFKQRWRSLNFNYRRIK
jgi:hypothetical protein